MEFDHIEQLIHILEKSGLTKLAVKKGDFEVLLEKQATQFPPHVIAHPIAEKALKENNRADAVEEKGEFVLSPMVGTFYASPSPDQPKYVSVGDRVAEDTVVCIIEAMKVMNEVKAGVNGVVKDILIDNSQPVEYGTKLFEIEKS